MRMSYKLELKCKAVALFSARRSFAKIMHHMCSPDLEGVWKLNCVDQRNINDWGNSCEK
ncbi:hypothetical protein CY34DRAFT_805868 [Suillus luteus UH-Slu-Lm8-n1]|uniref:Uncharacterized protein n=1 Tax=Suillus luteus UH-Slu-Lm8-n1 TaxID=930992 RepID=A0A0C9ZUQ4_9AGAM|nr:hypothetical protein CY34DRAFT_805868 [Suillus luteus UH-Slu-Lm8-n1]